MMNTQDQNSECMLDSNHLGEDQEQQQAGQVSQDLKLLQHSSGISDQLRDTNSQTVSASGESRSDFEVQSECEVKNEEDESWACNNRQTSISMNLDAQAKHLALQQLHRSISHQMPTVNPPQQVADSPASLDNLTVPNSSLFALMSKQQSRRDIKNTIQTKTTSTTGIHNLRGSLLGTASKHENESSTVNSKSIFSSSFNQDNYKEADNVSSNSAGIDTPKRKYMSLKKNGIKITNTTSTELKVSDFQDDDQVIWNENAYIELSKTYDIANNIQIAISTMLPPENLKKTEMVNDKMVTILPVLVSVKTEEQIFSLSTLESIPNGKKISHFQENSQASHEDNKDNKLIEGCVGVEKIEINLDCEKQSSKQGNKIEGKQIRNILDKARQLVDTEQKTSSDISNSTQSQEIQIIGDTLEVNEQTKQSEEKQENEGILTDSVKQHNAVLKTSNIDCSKDQKFQEDENADKQNDYQGIQKSNVIHSEVPETLAQNQLNESPRKISQKEALAERLSSLSRSSRFETVASESNGATNANNDSCNLIETHQYHHHNHHNHHHPLRFPIDLVCVIDTSGSMNGEPLDLVKETLLFLVELLQQGDRICLIQFSTNAKRLTPLLSIDTTTNRETIKHEIQQLNAKGGTNINQGMQLAFDVLKQRRIKNAISSVFLLSDGLNDGAENRIKEVLKSLNFYQNYSETNFTIQTFGFGKDHDPNLMDKISQLMDGNFYYIGDIHRIDECFIDALGGLFSVVSQNVNITVQVPLNARSFIKIIKTFGDIWNEKVQYYEYSININQLISGVSKDFVFEVEVDSNYLLTKQRLLIDENDDSQQQDNKESIKQFDNQEQNLLEVQLHAKNISLSEKSYPQEVHKTENLSLNEIIKSPQSVCNLVRLHYLRVLSAEGIAKCQEYAQEKKFDEGNQYVSRLLNELTSEPEETQHKLQKLIDDLKEAQDTLQKKISESLGWHRMISCKRMHMEQRSAGTDLAYQNSIQKIMVQRRQSIKHLAVLKRGGIEGNNAILLNPTKYNESNKPQGQLAKEDDISPVGSTNSSRSVSPVSSPKNN